MKSGRGREKKRMPAEDGAYPSLRGRNSFFPSQDKKLRSQVEQYR